MLYKDLNRETQENLRKQFHNKDYMVITIPRYEPIRVYTLRATRTLQTAKRLHAPEDADMVGKVFISALLLTSSVKHATKQKVLLKLELEEGIIAAEADATGKVRGFKEGFTRKPLKGTLTVIKELRLGVPFTSIVPIVSDDMKENMMFYFEQSEQVRTFVDMVVLSDSHNSIRYAGGYLVQAMGGTSKEALEFIEQRLKDVKIGALSDNRPEVVAYEILKDMEPKIIGLKEVEYYCPCTEDIAKSSLHLLSHWELEELFDNGLAEVVCKFCKRVYKFTKEEFMV
ncbi:MAG: Hsp33 family molecular chaperone HslO [Aquificaceae bacterium]